MLVQFNFKNFKSFKNESSLDLTAAPIKEHPYNLIENVKGDKLVKIAAIYGANASGKSNLIEAFDFMRDYVIHSLSLDSDDEGNGKIEEYLSVPNFLLSNTSVSQPSEFEVFFIINSVEYQYGFLVDKKKVHAEWLYCRRVSSKKVDTLFERMNNKIEVGPKMIKADIFKDSVNDRTLFLTLTAKTKINVSKKVLGWFRNAYVVNFGNINFEHLVTRSLSPELLENKLYKEKLEQFLTAIDSGIKGIRVERIEEEGSEKVACKLFSVHEAEESGKLIEFNFAKESSGTQKMFCLFDFFWDTLQSGGVLFIDELNAKLHPLLVRFIINMFHDTEVNKNNAQLIYTTHDVFTLTNDIFRRDEIWFTEKNKSGISRVYSLVKYRLEDSDSKVRNDAIYSKDYMLGRYGAVPLLKEFNMMGEI